jgi:hypothetical protein
LVSVLQWSTTRTFARSPAMKINPMLAGNADRGWLRRYIAWVNGQALARLGAIFIISDRRVLQFTATVRAISINCWT